MDCMALSKWIRWLYFYGLGGSATMEYSLSNGPMESFNRKPKDLKRESRGFSDFNYTRNRILWATRDNPSVRGIPKSNNEIKKNKGKKRGPYNKKK